METPDTFIRPTAAELLNWMPKAHIENMMAQPNPYGPGGEDADGYNSYCGPHDKRGIEYRLDLINKTIGYLNVAHSAEGLIDDSLLSFFENKIRDYRYFHKALTVLHRDNIDDITYTERAVLGHGRGHFETALQEYKANVNNGLGNVVTATISDFPAEVELLKTNYQQLATFNNAMNVLGNDNSLDEDTKEILRQVVANIKFVNSLLTIDAIDILNGHIKLKESPEKNTPG